MKRLDALAALVADYEIPRYREEVQWLLARVKELESVLRAVEFNGYFDGDTARCPMCDAESYQGHCQGCSVDAALRNLEEP